MFTLLTGQTFLVHMPQPGHYKWGPPVQQLNLHFCQFAIVPHEVFAHPNKVFNTLYFSIFHYPGVLLQYFISPWGPAAPGHWPPVVSCATVHPTFNCRDSSTVPLIPARLPASELFRWEQKMAGTSLRGTSLGRESTRDSPAVVSRRTGTHWSFSPLEDEFV